MLLLALLACDPEPTDPCLPGGEPSLTLGTGEYGYEPIEDALELIYGPQGGYHVLVGFETTHLDIEQDVVAMVSGHVNDTIVADAVQPQLILRCNSDTGTQQAWGTFLILLDGLDPDQVIGETIEIEAVLTDAGDQTVSATASADVYFTE